MPRVWRLWASVAALGIGAIGANAQPISVVGDIPDGAAIVDIRDESACLSSAPTGARCLPAQWMLDNGSGTPISFHALRWLLGTVDLTGEETVVIYDGPNGASAGAGAVAALLHLAGQDAVQIYDGPAIDAGRGYGRSLTRGAVYTAPMRLEALAVAAAPPPVGAQLVRYAGQGGTVTFAAFD